MAASPGFIFGPSTGVSYEELQQRRKVLSAMMAQQSSRAPQNLGEGIYALGSGIIDGLEMRSLRKEGEAMRDKQDALWGDIGSAMDGSTSALAYDPARIPAATPSSSSGFTPSFKGSAAENDNGLASYQTALLDTISGPESAGSYNVMYGGGKFGDFGDHPRQDIRIASGPNAGKTSSAAGRYQFLGSTWDEERDELGLKDFSPANQDKAAWNLASKTYRAKTGQDLNEVLQSGDPDAIASVGKTLNGVWTSLPGGIEQGTNTDRFTSAYQAALNRSGSAHALQAAAPAQGQPVQVASLDPSAGMAAPGTPPTTRQALEVASAKVNAAQGGGASIDGQMRPEDQARYNQLVGRQPGQVDPNAVPYTGPAEYNTPELRLDTDGARVTRDSEEMRGSPLPVQPGAPVTTREALNNAAAQVEALPPPQTVEANPVPPAAAALSPAVQQAAAADPQFDGFSQNQSPYQRVATAMMDRGLGLPDVPEAPAFRSPDMTPVQRVSHAMDINRAQRGEDPTALLRVLRSPDASPEQRELASSLLDRLYARQDLAEKRAYEENDPDNVLKRDYMRAQISAMAAKQPNTTNDIREYEYARQGGFPGTFADYQQSMRKAGATTVNTGENTSEFVKKSDEGAAKRLGEIVEAGNAAPAFMGDVQTLAELGKAIGTGKGAQVMAAFGPYADALGFKLDGLDEAQAYNGIVSRLAPQMRPAGAGATSDFDARQFLAALPSLGNTPGGNEIIQQTFQAVSENKMAAAEIAQRAQSGDMRWQDAEREIRALPNPYERFKAIRAKPGDPRTTAGAGAGADYRTKYGLE